MFAMFLSMASSLTVLLGLWLLEWRNRKEYVYIRQERRPISVGTAAAQGPHVDN